MKTRTLRFPTETSLGYLHTRQGGYPYAFHGRFKKEGGLLDGVVNEGWTLHGEARGRQVVTGDVRLLEVPAQPAQNLAPLAHISPDALQAIWLGNTWVDDAQLRHLQHLTGLRWLNIENNGSVTDKGLEKLAGLTSLQHLGIHWTRVTDAGLQHLCGMKDLRFLDVWGCEIKRESLAKLKEDLPNCDIRV